jgi:hypothetical protein
MTIEGFQRIIIFFGRAQGLGQGESAGAILGYEVRIVEALILAAGQVQNQLLLGK